MENSNNRIAVGYIRVSTDNQAHDDKFGIESQRSMIKEYADRNGYTIKEWFMDEGVSGVVEDRPAGFNRILYSVENPPYTHVLVAKNDRVARDINVYFYYKMLLAKKDITLVSISEDFGQFGAFSSILEAFTLCVAEMERNNITNRTSTGRNIKAQKGEYSGGSQPFGYAVQNGQLVPHPVNAEYAVEIFNMREQGHTMQEIADYLNDSGIQTNRGKKFRTSTIQAILANEPTYRGYYKYGKMDWVRGNHEPLI